MSFSMFNYLLTHRIWFSKKNKKTMKKLKQFNKKKQCPCQYQIKSLHLPQKKSSLVIEIKLEAIKPDRVMGSVIHSSPCWDNRISSSYEFESNVSVDQLIMRGKIWLGCVPTVITLCRYRLWYHRAKNSLVKGSCWT